MRRLLNDVRAVALLGLCVAAGCAFEDEPVGGQGVRGAGAFVYACASASDPVCDPPDDGSGDALPLPERIAVGATFEVTYAFEDDGEAAQVRAASPALIGRDEAWVALQPGLIALYAVDGESRIAAWRHVSLVHAASMVVDGVAGTALQVGDEVSLRAHVLDAEGEPLAGGLGVTWLAEPAGVVEVVVGDGAAADSATANEALVRAVAAGDVVLTIEAGGVSSTVDFVVIGDEGSGVGQ